MKPRPSAARQGGACRSIEDADATAAEADADFGPGRDRLVHVDAGGDVVTVLEQAVRARQHDEGDDDATIELGELDGAVNDAAAGRSEDDVLRAHAQRDR